MPALTFHEAIPGHHLQLSISRELKNIPKFRKYGGFTAYTEGWGLYAEYIPKEMGFYQDLYEDFGRLSMELLRALRLVVDTGIHHKKWSREKAIQYTLENSAQDRAEVVRQVERYIVNPGQATAYKIGMMKILELRKKAQELKGAKFKITEFHDEILKYGALPLDILEKRILAWASL